MEEFIIKSLTALAMTAVCALLVMTAANAVGPHWGYWTSFAVAMPLVFLAQLADGEYK